MPPYISREESTVNGRRWDRPPRDQFDDHHILELLQAGNIERAWEPLWLKYAEPFARFAATYYIFEQGPEDCISDFLLKMVQRDASKWKELREPQKFPAFLWTSFRHYMNDLYRKKQWEIPMDDLLEPRSYVDEDMEPYCVNCFRRAWHAFGQKYPMAWDMIVRIVIEEWSHKELSAYIEKIYHQTKDRRHYNYWLKKWRKYTLAYVQRVCGECLPWP
jgi:hypothetical protein